MGTGAGNSPLFPGDVEKLERYGVSRPTFDLAEGRCKEDNCCNKHIICFTINMIYTFSIYYINLIDRINTTKALLIDLHGVDNLRGFAAILTE